MALQFNNGPNNKIVGQMYLDGLEYEYTIYLMPIQNTPVEAEVVSFFGNRKQDGKICLGVNTATIKKYIKNDNPQVSAFIIVNQKDEKETASGTIQIYNWCNRDPVDNDTLVDSQIWINDVCRIINPFKGKLSVSPIKAFFTLIEQFAVQKLGKSEIYLMVKKEKPKTVISKGIRKVIDKTNKLIEIYNSYGFIENNTNCKEPIGIQDKNSIVANYETMKKDNIVANTSIVDLTSVVISGGGKRRKTRKVIKRRRKSKKSRRY